MKNIGIIEPFLNSKEKNELVECINKREISSYGKKVNQLEREVKKHTKSKYNLASSSGSAALIISYKALNIKDDDMVIMPSYTFIATLASAVHNNANIWLFDIDPNTLCIDIEQLKISLKEKTYKKGNYHYHKKTKKRVFAICPVLTFGIVPDLLEIKKIANHYNLKVILDAAAGFGSNFKGKDLSKYCDIAVYSMNGNKTFTSGGGGIISTNKSRLYKLAKLYLNNGKNKSKYNHSVIGFNFKLTNLHAAIALAQLKKIKEIFKRKNKINNIYKKNLNNKNILLAPEPKWSNHCLWFNFIIIKKKSIKKFLNNLNKIKFNAQLFWKPMHLQKFDTKKIIIKEKLKYSEFLWKRLIPLPSSINLTMNLQLKIINIIKNNIK